MGVISSFKSWIKQPFATSMNLGGWVLFTGLVLVLAIAWTRVLNHVVE